MAVVEDDSRIVDMVAEVYELRFGVTPFDRTTPEGYVNLLVDVRRRIDRIEEILILLTTLRGQALRGFTILNAEYDFAWDKSAQAINRAGNMERCGPRERYAENNLAAFEEARARREADLRYKELDAAVDAVRIAHRGLDGVRSDVTVALRAQSLQTSLET